MLQYIFEKSCFFDLEDNQGQMIYTTGEIIGHPIGSSVDLEDYDNEITGIEEEMTAYDRVICLTSVLQKFANWTDNVTTIQIGV